jgi:hypothetical protein
LGYLIVGMFLAAWALSVAVWKFGCLETRYGIHTGAVHVHAHAHEGGLRHTHDHLHGPDHP